MNKNKVNEIWEKLKIKNNIQKPSINQDKLVEKKENFEIIQEINTSEIDLQIQAALNKVKEIKNKTITETVYFAGKKYE